MSETTTPTPAATPQPAEPPFQHALASEENEDATQPLQTPPDPPPEPAKADAPAEGEKPPPDPEEERKAERRREAARIGYLTKQRYAEKARADALAAQLREFQTQQNGGQQRAPTPDDIAAWVDQRAAEKIEIEKRVAKINEWDSKGAEQFGAEQFHKACQTLADFIPDTNQRQAILDVAMDSEGGHRAIMEMAGNAEEAERILSLPPHRMALAIAKLGETTKPAPKPVSSAPPPITPPQGGRPRGAPDPEKGSFADFKRWSAEQPWKR